MFITGLQPIWKISSIVICYRSPPFIKPGKKAAKFAVQVCGSEKSFAVAEVQEITADVPRICGCGPPIAILRNLRLRNRVQICGAQHCYLLKVYEVDEISMLRLGIELVVKVAWKIESGILIKSILLLCTRCIIPKHVTSLRGPFPRHCDRAKHLFSKKCSSGCDSLATPCPIRPAKDLNLKPPVPDTNLLLLDNLEYFMGMINRKLIIQLNLSYFRLFYCAVLPIACNNKFIILILYCM